ncbi:YkvA family protein [Cobetia sp. L2A1]|uniref:YkvA family protein n=1 Tax=Cobetia sp. L2A1 TaxID=2686360 RepID=UPI00131E8107|nr:YkvA family protein [Cobetia sp. L2A1]
MTANTRTPAIIQADKAEPARHAERVSDAQANLHVHADAYSTAGFWNKVSNVAKKAGKTVLNPAFRMYFAAQDPDTPIWARTTIYGALGYFISPIDALPDFTPLLGYTDDLTLMAGAVAIVAAHIKQEHAERADKVLKRWFN